MLSRLGISSRLSVLVGSFVAGLLIIGAFGLQGLHQNLLRDRMESARQAVELVHDMLSELATAVRHESMTRNELQRLALSVVRGLRYGEHTYLWINDRSPAMLMHPYRPDLEGKAAGELGDPLAEGLFPVMEKRIDESGEGFITYQWPLPGNRQPVEKASYVKEFKPWGWVIGSGVYTTDVRSIFRDEALTAISIGTTVLGVVLVLAISISESIRRPLSAITADMRRLTCGDTRLTNHEIGDRGELGDLAKALRAFQAHVRENEDLRREKVALLQREQESLRKLSRAVEQSPGSIIITDPEGRIEYVNEKFVDVTGYRRSDVIGRNPSILRSGLTPDKVYKELWATILAGREWRGELHNRRKNGETYWEYVLISPIKRMDGSISHFLAIKEDITVRKSYEDRLIRQANYDSLTNLPNRILALDRLHQSLALAGRRQHKVAVLFIDLDHFKNVNDTLGHAAGDKLLVETADRLRHRVRREDTVARLGGDEFLVVIPDVVDIDGAETVANHLLGAFSKPFVIGSDELFVSASIGITIAPTDGHDAHDLMRNADAAMYQAKSAGRNTFRMFTRDITQLAEQRMRVGTRLRRALARGELELHYQPLIDTRHREIHGAEALIRWNDRELGAVSPEQFIPIAEESGLIVEIGEWVLEQACRTAVEWRTPRGAAPTLAVNVSFRQFLSGDFPATVERVLRESGMPARRLVLEITEGVLVEDTRQTEKVLHELKRLGVRLSVDDFGTGYSSLSYLKRFPVDALKIDRTFVRDCTTDEEDAELVTAIIAMARSLRLSVVGEGVENDSQYQFLRTKGCTLVQGFFFSPPLSRNAMLEFFMNWPITRGRNAGQGDFGGEPSPSIA